MIARALPKITYMKYLGGLTGTTLDDYLDHVDYVTNLVGIDHVGIGEA